MGNSLPASVDPKNRKKLIIVGFSYAGFNLAQQLWDHYDVTVIDQNAYFEHICANVKVGVDPEFSDKILHGYDKMA
jgi:hypothetical protein